MASSDEQLREVPPLPDQAVEARRHIFEELFVECPAEAAKAKSLDERKEHALGGKSLTYGEVSLDLMHHVLNIVRAEHGPLYAGKGTFLDLGSGAGKACFAAALLHPFEKVVGVETLHNLHSLAMAAHAKYQEAQVPDGNHKPEVQFIRGDFVTDFEALGEVAANVVLCFAVATCFGERELQGMAALARRLPEGAVVVSFVQGLPERLLVDPERHPKQRRAAAVKKALAKRGVEPSTVEVVVEPPVIDPEGFVQVHQEVMQVPWGAPATCFIYKKVPKPHDHSEAHEVDAGGA